MVPLFNRKAERNPGKEPDAPESIPPAGFHLTEAVRDIQKKEGRREKPVIRAGWPRDSLRRKP